MVLKTVSILGATGSVGKSTLSVIKDNQEDFKILLITANNNVEELARLAIEYNVDTAIITNENKYIALKELLAHTNIKVAAGGKALVEAAKQKVDITVAAIVGIAGLAPTIASIANSKKLLLANKECLVCAGKLFMQEIAKYNCKLLPIDSEHNAIFQALASDNFKDVKSITLTASGGPFLHLLKEEMSNATVERALKHPNWSMGKKITIDSATMMNKGFEFIEAYHIFPIEVDNINILVHPQSIIHGLVQYIDGSILAQMGDSDMRIPIAHALSWPERISSGASFLDLSMISQLEFFPLDLNKFPAVSLCQNILNYNGSMAVILNAVNEIAVESFLGREINFDRITSLAFEVIEKTISSDYDAPVLNINDVYDYDSYGRRKALELI